MEPNPPDPVVSLSDNARSRVRQIFEFLRDFDGLRNPPVLRREQLSWRFAIGDLPRHPCIWCPYPVEDSAVGLPAPEFRVPERIKGRGIILAVKRPKTSDPKAPPRRFEEWVQGLWRDPFANVSLIDSREDVLQDGSAHVTHLGDDADRSAALTTWIHSWHNWAATEQPARQAMGVFSGLYALQGILEREGDRQELVVGDGVLNWSLSTGSGAVLLDHPLLLQPVELYLDADTFTFFVIETDAPLELYASLLRHVPTLGGEPLAVLRRELENLDASPISGTVVDAFLRRVGARLDPNFQFLGEDAPMPFQPHPAIWRSPMLLLRSRSRGFSKAIDEVLEGISQGRELPGSLVRIVGLEPVAVLPTSSEQAPEPQPSGALEDANRDFLFSKPSNREQERILERLERSDSVVVQGPPGTGKTHTIANLIGHLLASGKSVLVTSHTEKALRVVRDKVAEPLQALCLPVLGSDIDSRRELERSVEAILEHTSFDDIGRLKLDVRALQARRHELLGRKASLRVVLRETRLAEYRDIVFGGEAVAPSEAARLVRDSQERYEWLPGPLKSGAALPLSATDLERLYATNLRLSVDDEDALRTGLPPLEDLPPPDRLEATAAELSELAPRPIASWEACWKEEPSALDAGELQVLLADARALLERLLAMEAWQVALADHVFTRSARVTGWRAFLEHLDKELPAALQIRDAINRLGPTLPVTSEAVDLQGLARAIEAFLGGDRKLTRWALI